jgi:mRNA interferase MazF
MSVRRGEVVLLDMPFAQGGGSKIRPALVVQSDHNNARISNTVVVSITRNISRVREATQLLVDITTPPGRQSGLLANSAVTCENLFTVDQKFIQRTVGSLPPITMRQVDDRLKAALGIP